MKITVIETGGTAPSTVRFRSAAGSTSGVWRGETSPELRDYDVELEIPDKLLWGQDAYLAHGSVSGLHPSNGETRVVGRALECDATGTLVLDVSGTIVMVEVSNRPAEDVVGTFVAVRVQHLQIYPTIV